MKTFADDLSSVVFDAISDVYEVLETADSIVGYCKNFDGNIERLKPYFVNLLYRLKTSCEHAEKNALQARAIIESNGGPF